MRKNAHRKCNVTQLRIQHLTLLKIYLSIYLSIYQAEVYIEKERQVRFFLHNTSSFKHLYLAITFLKIEESVERTLKR